MRPSRRRGVGAVVVLGAIITAGVLVSPSATGGILERIVDDPVVFGMVLTGLYVVRPLLAWPTTPLAIAVGYGYGVTVGVPLALVLLLVTVTPTFLITRWYVTGCGDTTEALPFDGAFAWAGTALTRYYETAGPVRGVVVSRLLPIHSDVSTCAAAASGVTYRQLLLGTTIGELPWTVAAVFVGASAATIITDGLGEVGLLVTVGCLLAAALLLAGPVYTYSRRARDETTTHQNVSEQS